MEQQRKTPVHRQPPLGGLYDFYAGCGVVTGRSSDLQACPSEVIGVSTGPSSRFQRKTSGLWVFDPAYHSGAVPDSQRLPFNVPLGTSPANEPQDRGLFASCQPKCCGFVMLARFKAAQACLSGIVVQVRPEPSLDFGYAHSLALLVVHHLIAADFSQTEIPRFRVSEVQPAHTGARPHGK